MVDKSLTKTDVDLIFAKVVQMLANFYRLALFVGCQKQFRVCLKRGMNYLPDLQIKHPKKSKNMEGRQLW